MRERKQSFLPLIINIIYKPLKVLFIRSMARDDLAQLEGKVVDVAAGGMYKVELENQIVIQAKLCGKMRRFNIRVVVGDKVTVGVSPYDPTHGLIMYRHK